ncbi:MAG: hypothetical protein ACKO2C_02305 [Actinomycetes bacterium]
MAAIRTAPGTARGRRYAAPLATFAVLALVGTVIPLLIARHYGALGAARGDDWSYLVTLFRWVDTGRMEFNDWVSMSLLGQLLLAAPIAAVWGHATAIVQVETAIVGLAGLVAVVTLGRRLGLSQVVAATVALAVAVNPLWMILTTTYMTDVWAFTVSTIALLVAVVALDRRPVPLPMVVGALVIAAYAVTIRQYALVVVVAICLVGGIALLGRRDTRIALGAALGAVAVAAALIGFFVWWYSVPDSKALSPAFPEGRDLRTSVIRGAGFLRLVGLSSLPALALAGPLRILRRSLDRARGLTVLVLMCSTAWMAVTATRYLSSQFVGNYVIRDGALSIAVLPGIRPPVMPGPLWSLLVFTASLTGILLLVAAVPMVADLADRVRRRDTAGIEPVTSLLGITVVGYAMAYGLAAMTGLQVYDRYALPALPLVSILLLRACCCPGHAPITRARIALTAFAFVALAVVGVNLAVDSASFDGARWRLALEVSNTGRFKPKQVNGGFEWVNFHRGRRGTVGSRTTVARILPDGRVIRIARFCVNLRSLPPGESLPPSVAWRIMGSRSYVAPLREPARIVALRSTRPCRAPNGSRPVLGPAQPSRAP